MNTAVLDILYAMLLIGSGMAIGLVLGSGLYHICGSVAKLWNKIFKRTETSA